MIYKIILKQPLKIEFPYKYNPKSKMRMEKQNQYPTFTKLLTRIDASNLGDYELKVLKQEHDYLDRLRHQRIKIQDLKRKYDQCQGQLCQQRQQCAKLINLVQEKSHIIEDLQQQLSSQITKRQSLQKTLQKHLESDKSKSKNRTKQLEQENQQLRKLIRQKQLIILSIQQECNEKIKKCKESYSAEKRSLLLQLDERLTQAKSKASQPQLLQLRNLVSRQNKALKLQNQKFEQLSQTNNSLISQLSQLRYQLQTKQQQTQHQQQKIRQLYEQLQGMQTKLGKQENNNRLKGQLEEIRRRMAEMQKGEIQRIEFIVNQME